MEQNQPSSKTEAGASVTFPFKFFGWLEAPARRWINPDGSEGGIVALDATIDEKITLSIDVVIGPRASVGEGASIGPRVSIGEGASVGECVSIGPRASVGDGASIGECVSIGPRASVGEGASIGECVSIGPRASVGECVSIGPRASVGEGASIGECVSIGPRASVGEGASIGPRASVGEGASIGECVSIGDGDWHHTISPIGSRNAMATAVYSNDFGLRWWVGCQHGISTEELLERVQEKHGDSEHGDDYRAAVEYVKNHPALVRAIAKMGIQAAHKEITGVH